VIRLTPFLLLCGTGLLAIFSSTLAKSPVLPLFAGHLGADASTLGLVAALGPLTGVLGSIPAGLLADRFGRRRMLLVSGWLFATAPLLYLIADNLLLLGLARVYHGLATAIFMPVALAMVADISRQGRGERIGWFSTATLAGRFVAPLTGGLLLAGLAMPPAAVFQVVFLVCLAGGLLSLLFAANLPEPALSLKPVARSRAEMLVAFRRVAATPGILPAAMAEAAILFMYGAFETFLPIHVVSAGLGGAEAGFLISLQVITLALTKPLLGRLSDRHGRNNQIFLGGLGGMLAMGLLASATSFQVLLIASIGIGLALSMVTSATTALIADLSRPEERGAAMGVLNSIMDVGHAASPLAAGLVAVRFGLPSAFLAAAAVLGCASLIFRLLAAPESDRGGLGKSEP
jgi:MFS transporter, DHA1 family, multidrug resistance protein